MNLITLVFHKSPGSALAALSSLFSYYYIENENEFYYVLNSKYVLHSLNREHLETLLFNLFVFDDLSHLLNDNGIDPDVFFSIPLQAKIANTWLKMTSMHFRHLIA